MKVRIVALCLGLLLLSPLSAQTHFYPANSNVLTNEERASLTPLVVRAEERLHQQLEAIFHDVPVSNRLRAGSSAHATLETAVWFNYRYGNGYIPEAELANALFQIINQFNVWLFDEMDLLASQKVQASQIEDLALKASLLFTETLYSVTRNLHSEEKESLEASLRSSWAGWAHRHLQGLPQQIEIERQMALIEGVLESPIYSWGFALTSVLAILANKQLGIPDLELWMMAGSFALFFEGFVRNLEGKLASGSSGRAPMEENLIQHTLLRIDDRVCENYLVAPDRILAMGQLRLIQ